VNVVAFPRASEAAEPIAAPATADPFAGLTKSYYASLLADPPWKFKARTAIQSPNWKSPRHVERHYRTMTFEDIKALPVQSLAAKDAHLFLCATGPCLKQAFEVMEAWGFRYSSVAFTWVKLKRSFDSLQLVALPTMDGYFHVGLGLTTRKNCEFVLLGRRGSPKRLSKKVRELIISPVREHSRKPPELYDRVCQYASGPYLELFSRQIRPGWECWGNETTKFGPDA
jgi:N6-adenosine-specific RNA methylase IME4